MLMIWVNKTDIDDFAKKLEDVYGSEYNGCDCSTYPPKDIKNYIQLIISYDEYKQLEDIGVI